MTETRTRRTVGDIMSEQPVVIRAGAPLGDAVKLLDRDHIAPADLAHGMAEERTNA